MAVTIADLQTRYRERLQQKKKKALDRSVYENLSRFAVDGPDGAKFLTAESLKNSCDELSHDLLKKEEADFLFAFWDTMAGKQEATGYVPIELAVYDLKQSEEQYNGQDLPFRSGEETLGRGGGGNKSNVSSLGAGGIFGGGSYEADARSDRGSVMAGGAPPAAPMQQPASPSGRPRGNQSSIAGGIFGENTEAQPPPSSRSNRSNQSSIPGGIFGESAPMGMPKAKKFDSNRSSIQGGIFG